MVLLKAFWSIEYIYHQFQSTEMVLTRPIHNDSTYHQLHFSEDMFQAIKMVVSHCCPLLAGRIFYQMTTWQSTNQVQVCRLFLRTEVRCITSATCKCDIVYHEAVQQEPTAYLAILQPHLVMPDHGLVSSFTNNIQPYFMVDKGNCSKEADDSQLHKCSL